MMSVSKQLPTNCSCYQSPSILAQLQLESCSLLPTNSSLAASTNGFYFVLISRYIVGHWYRATPPALKLLVTQMQLPLTETGIDAGGTKIWILTKSVDRHLCFKSIKFFAFASPMANMYLIPTVGFLYLSVSGSFSLHICIFDRAHSFEAF